MPDEALIGKLKSTERGLSRPKYIDVYSKRLREPRGLKVQTTQSKVQTTNRKFLTKPIRTEPDEVRRSEPLGHGYQLQGLIGKGTFGSVYVAEIRHSGEKVAIKKVLQDRRYKNRELEILKMLHHPHILEMRDYYMTQQEDEEYLNVVMDYYPENLHQAIRRSQFTPTLIKLYLFQLLQALNYLTTLGIAHRDIKPQNILIDKLHKKVVICDFGSAKVLVNGEPNLAYICSRCYRAPELIFGATDYNPQIDVWSLGCVGV